MLSNIDNTRDDYNWVPKCKYEQLVEKLNAVAMENNSLKEENRKLKEASCTGKFINGLPIGNGL